MNPSHISESDSNMASSHLGHSARRSANVWSVGDRVLAYADDAIAFIDDEPEHWLPATIAQVHPWVGVHFDGYADRWPNHVQWDQIKPAPILGPVGQEHPPA